MSEDLEQFILKGMAKARRKMGWLANITYIRILAGFIYMAAISDACSQKVIGYAISLNLETTLLLKALSMVIVHRKPIPGVIHHADQGIKYAADEHITELKENEFTISMSRSGNFYDNATMERFFETLKYEEVYLCECETYKDVLEKIPSFIEAVYDHKRLHSGISYLTPLEV